MSVLTLLFACLLYASAGVFAAGVAWRVHDYLRTPVPLKIPTTPAPATRGGAAARVAREVVFFESLFRANKWIWLFGWLFHAALVLVLVRHVRYFTEPVWGWVAFSQPFGIYAGFVMLTALAGLWARRFLVERVRYISTWSDHLMLALLAGIAASGLVMKYFVSTDIVAVKAFTLGLMYFDLQPLPADPVLMVHLLLVAVLMAIFPASKLMHAPGVFFSPTRNQADDAREHRHVTPWAARAD